jgi:hypothetical protein
VKSPIARILWFALLLSQVIYLVVASVLPGDPASSPASVSVISLALAIVSIGIAALTLVMRRRALVAPIQAGQLDPNTPEGHQRAFVPFIINLVLTESIAINGLVIALLSREPQRAYPFAIAGFALMYWHRPTAPDLSPPAAFGTYRPPAM